MKEISLNKSPFGYSIGKDKEGRVSLTDLWKAAGQVESKAPKFWIGQDATAMFIDTLATVQKVTQDYLITVKRGKSGGTFADKQIALAYAKYLSPELHIAVNQIFFERIEEEKNPDKIAERYVDTYTKKGRTKEWIEARFKGVSTRNTFTKTLKAHDVTGPDGYKKCTNAIYKPLYGGDTKLIRSKKSLSENDKVRDNMSAIELKAVEFAESLAVDIINKDNIRGNENCAKACLVSSQQVAQSIVNARKALQK